MLYVNVDRFWRRIVAGRFRIPPNSLLLKEKLGSLGDPLWYVDKDKEPAGDYV